MSDLPIQWFPDHINGEIAPLTQAKNYPYPAPDMDYWMRDGMPELRPDGIKGDELAARTAVLSVGSNRAPLQLRRKFGTAACLPVTTCRLLDCDIVFAATLSFYCASPATPCPSPGTVVNLNIAWLDDAQLLKMHETEALGVAYDYVQLDDGIVDHHDSGDHPAFKTPVYGYQSRSPLLDLGRGFIAHTPIPAQGRVFHGMTQPDVLVAIKNHVSWHGDLDDWIYHMRADRDYRLAVMTAMQSLSAHCPDAPWSRLDVTAQRPDDFL